ncbi:MAG: UPF0149 family protein [Proteobacteria bacterium]|nr:UPF0149 family protein [Pseudomonadota bacterium]
MHESAAPHMRPPDPSEDALPAHADLASALRSNELAVDPCELHGALCGFIAGGGDAGAVGWLQRLALDAAADADRDPCIAQLRGATLAQFADEDFGLQLLLPADHAPLAERVDGLLAWCRGFLGGVGLAAPKQSLLSAESTEALADLARIAASDLGYEGSEEDEDALAEIIEFVRMAPLLIHADCVCAGERRRRAH